MLWDKGYELGSRNTVLWDKGYELGSRNTVLWDSTFFSFAILDGAF